MPLPAPNTAFPPPPHGLAFKRMAEHAAWWSGDPAALEQQYTGDGAQGPRRPPVHGAQYAGGIVGRAARWWWGTPSTELRRTRRHVPLPADIAEQSAALLFAQPPTFKTPEGTDQATTRRLDDIANTPAMRARLHEGAESQAALGGIGLRVVWDDSVADHAFLDVVDADHVIPTFRWGTLVALTFVTVLPPLKDDGVKWRHLERHELDGTGSDRQAVIRHGLYAGRDDTLGRRASYDEHPATAYLLEEVGAGRLIEDAILTGARSGLTAAYVPNVRGQRRGDWRHDATLRELGRSDFDGIEGLFDAIDETWSSLMRDVDLAKGRITIPESWLTDLGAGRGTFWDSDRQVYSAVSDAAGGASGRNADPVVTQFALRASEHLQVVEALTRTAVKTAGYSPLTFGLVDEVAMTATEASARERATFRTRDAKTGYWGEALGPLLRTLLEVDGLKFPGQGGGQLDGDVVCEWPAAAEDPMSVRATVVEALHRSESASTRQRVAMLHPDWDDAAIDAEVDLILGETGRSLPDPIGDGEQDPPADPAPGLPA